MEELKNNNMEELERQIQEKEKLIEQRCSILGRKYYVEHRTDTEPGMQEDVRAIDDLFGKIRELKQQIALERGKSICPKCGEEAEKEDRFCPQCGARMPHAEESLAEDMVSCPQCGQVMAKGQKFCAKCGCNMQEEQKTAQEAKEEPLKCCPKCGAAVEADMKFCMTCGQKLK